MKLHKILLLLLSIPIFGFSFNEEGNFVKQRIINKAYFVNADVGIKISNSYGNITIQTWDENKIELEILIKVTGDNEKWVNKRFDAIDVDLKAFTNLVTAKTIIEDSDSYNNNNHNNSYEINYVIKIPKNGIINLENKYGNIFTTDLINDVSINCKYGKIVLGKINGNSCNIELGYCPKSTIEFLKNGKIEAKYSGLSISNANNLNLDTDYTDVFVDDCQNLVYQSNYGKLNLKKINQIKGSGNYMSLIIGELENNLDLESNYSKIAIGLVHEKANNIIIDSRYSDVSIGYDSNFAFNFNLSTKYGNINYDKDFEIINSEITNSTKAVDGFHKQKSNNKVNISSMYGNINLVKKQ